MTTPYPTPTATEPAAAPAKPAKRLLHRRWLACWIDFLLVCFALQVPELPGPAMLANYPGTMLSMIPAYYCLSEWRWGRTAGKWMLGIAVVNGAGGRPRLWQAVVRTVFRALEINPLAGGGLLAGVVASLSKNEQRLGDMVAETYVVRARRCR